MVRGELYSIAGFSNAFVVRAVGAAKELLITLHPVTYDTTPTVETGRGEGLNRALKAIEGVPLVIVDDIECFVVGVVADGADAHGHRLKNSCRYCTTTP